MFGARRLLVLLVVSTVVVAACSVGTGGDGGTRPGAPPIAVEPPPDAEWRREIAGITVLGSGTDPDSAELALIEAGLGELPDSLVMTAGLGDIYRLRDGAIEVEDRTLAFSRGPDIFLIDRTFADDPTLFDMANLLAHELAHVLQFNRLTTADVDAITGLAGADPITGSAFVRDYAEATGWIDRDSGSGTPAWLLRDPTGTTAYGATAPEEDMAESMAMVLTGREDEISRVRLEWLEELLDVDATRFITGKPYIPNGAERIDPSRPLYQTDAVAITAARRADPISFTLPAAAAAGPQLAADIEARLLQRGLGGSLDREDDRRIERYAGRFLRGDGLSYWVELWDFRNAPGFVDPPEAPVLTYVILWGQ